MRCIVAFFAITFVCSAQDIAATRKAAEAGDAHAQNQLGVDYQWGRGVEKDFSQAAKWFKAAARQGYAPAQFNLGVMYLEGEEFGTDHAKAAAWFTLAKDGGDKSAEDALRRLPDEANGPIRLIGMTEAGRMLLLGQEIKQDSNRGMSFLTSAAKESFGPAELILCIAQIKGEGTAPDPVAGAHWCEKAIEHGQFTAYSFYGRELLSGQHVPQNRAKGIELLSSVAGDHDKDAFLILGNASQTNPVEAEKWYLLGVTYQCARCLEAHNAQKQKLSGGELKNAAKMANAWLAQRKLSTRIDLKKLGY